ncbi:hypothetical protein N7492_000593 [Penicillium capsulatum]|uniref:Uncharacterized protein n=1 Tax=Penicillium capsulatum TaxID=69766 RepID=A0A9W9M091_9EURO|nr:hypothetical protein N7492_000593 [Penicillium capsulatum]KAJ6130349.1 hypothetical protein N7512_003129 [Penicillium capsulatum]
MTDSEMQQPTETIPMFPTDSENGPPSQQAQSLDPRNSLDDYNRTMLEYTQRQMSSFVDLDDTNGAGLSGTSSRSSHSSGNSGRSGASNNGSILARQANGPPPTSASAAAARRGSQQSRTPSEPKAGH